MNLDKIRVLLLELLGNLRIAQKLSNRVLSNMNSLSYLVKLQHKA
jgi:hypothetical protein